jgi:hypothetical protein
MLTNPDSGLELKLLFNHGSNDPWFLHMEFIPIHVTSKLACIVDVTTTDVPTCFHANLAFTTANLTVPNILNSRMMPHTR